MLESFRSLLSDSMDQRYMRQAFRHALIGYGYMGTSYLRILSSLRPNDSYVVVDVVSERRDKALLDASLLPLSAPIEVAESLEGITADVVWILCNTPEHLNQIKAALQKGIRKIFVEKPIVMESQLREFDSVDFTGVDLGGDI